MAWIKVARLPSKVSRVSIKMGDWSEVRRSAGEKSEFDANSKIIRLGDFKPDQYLLSHVTIVASVDVEPNEFYITPGSSRYINGNGDAFERKLLRNTFRSFIGAENYLEHVQIPTLSKGKILDAVVRDLGDTDYVDILVATNVKHKDLIKKIEAGELTAMSMGANVAYTICTRCGHRAEDGASLCPHVMYAKGSTFLDENGVERRVAELCGHHSDTASNVFIEASWVADPAFKGAVRRSTIGSLEGEELAAAMESMGVKASVDGERRVASQSFAIDLNALRASVDVINQARKVLGSLDGVVKVADSGLPAEVRPIEDQPEAQIPVGKDKPLPSGLQDENLIACATIKEMFSGSLSDKAASNYESWVRIGVQKGWDALVSESVSQRHFLTAVVLSDRLAKNKHPFTSRLAKVLESAGPRELYLSDETFMARCGNLLGRPMASKEQEMLLKYGALLGRFKDEPRASKV